MSQIYSPDSINEEEAQIGSQDNIAWLRKRIENRYKRNRAKLDEIESHLFIDQRFDVGLFRENFFRVSDSQLVNFQLAYYAWKEETKLPDKSTLAWILHERDLGHTSDWE